jgi:vancomycin resistance protein YoaR
MDSPVTATAPKANRPALVAGVIFIIIILSSPFAYLAAMRGRVLFGVSTNGLSLGGLTKEEADAKLNAAIAIYENKGLNFTNGKKTENIDATQIPDGDIDAARQLLEISGDTGLSNAYAVGRDGNIISRISDAANALINKKKLRLAYSMDAKGLKKALRQTWGNEEKTVIDAGLAFSFSGDELANIKVTGAESGFEFDYDRAVNDIGTKIASFDQTPVKLEPARTEPTITVAAAQIAKTLVPQALALAPLNFSTDELNWTLNIHELSHLIEVQLVNSQPTLGINKNAAQKYFETLAAAYDIAPQSTRYEIDPTTQKMTVFEVGRDGRKINVEASITALQTALATQLSGGDGKTGFVIVYGPEKTQVTTDSAAELGIKEVLGVGISDFSGSSGNRIINVKNGATKLNGVLIAPDEIFSVDKIIGPVTKENGYVDEQIIKGNMITTEVGGGLCQIGTTAFRAAMMSGMPIVERLNHALVVHYYGDARNGNPGTDATLYDPYADLKFKNNTGHWMLMTTAINVKTKKLAFTLWGTSDGRKGEYSAPQVIRWINAPAETQNVDDLKLKPGEQKCQNAFRGADTTFTYTITNPDGTKIEKIFNSHYRAVPKICSNGPALPDGAMPTDGTTPAPTNTNSSPVTTPVN